MKIFIEGSPLFWKPKTGVGEYTERILEQLAKRNPDNAYYVSFLSFLKPVKDLPLQLPNLTYRIVRFFPTKAYNLLQRWNLAPPLDSLAHTRPDVAVFFNFFRHRLLFTRKSITVVHDLAFFHNPAFIKSQKFANSLDRNVKRAVRVSTALVAISQNTKRDLVKHYQADPASIIVIYPALDAKYKPSKKSDISEALKKYDIKPPYLLFLGTLEPRKNVVGVIEAYGSLSRQLQNKYQLVLAGAPGWKYEQVEQAAAQLPDGRIKFTGYLDEKDKAPLYTGAEIFLLPSHYEGWGMPILEAMACGTPVLTARNSSLAEVGGVAAYYVKDSHDPEAIAKGIELLLNNTALRRRLRQRGLAQVRQFSWSKSADKMNELINKVAS